MFHADGQKDMMKLIVDAPKKKNPWGFDRIPATSLRPEITVIQICAHNVF